MILIAYGTKHGSTRAVAEAAAAALRERGLSVEIREAVTIDDLTPYDAVLLGTSIYTGRVHVGVLRFLERHRKALGDLPVAVFGIGPRTLDAADVDHSRSQLLKALREFPGVRPVSVAIFGGVIDPSVLRWPFNRMTPSDARDWPAIHDWARELAECPRFGKAAPAAREVPHAGSAPNPM